MPIRTTIAATPETIRGFEAAAEEKYEAGFNLMASEYAGTGIYLIGLAAEMLLKSAYFRCRRRRVNDPIDLREARNRARVLAVSADPESFHGLEFWASLIIETRRRRRAVAPVFETELLGHVRRLADNWLVAMPYHSIQGILKSDLEAVLEDIVWLKTNHKHLWR